MQSPLKFFAFLFLGLILTLGLVGCSGEPEKQPLRLQGQIFGTFWLATFPDDWSEDQAQQLEAGIIGELEAVNQSMSTYIEDSELNQLNQTEPGEWFEASDALFKVLAISQEVAEASEGAFDVTIGGLVNLWSFGPEARAEQIPETAELEASLAETGYAYLELDSENQRVRKLRDFYIDLSGVAKGYAVDQVGRWLQSQGVENYLINIGGDLIVGGERKPGQPWRIGVEVPDGTIQQAHHILPLVDSSIATSGDYRNYYEVEGRRMSHTINPQTGWPIDHNLASVTVDHPSNAVADAWATAFMVLGVEKSLEAANREGIKLLMISREEESWKTWISEPYREKLGEEQSQKLLK
ncbi:thiamine biosynthesis lipoprotein [Marinospirillum celere]|uniref:FAD:protein FMN transferase n=1 Tax=Marinospirillum celere TaxID=1122252 RepID=A0A1I1I6J9_9GAMM|nr:FAD:protein FMN transferase [Marinospirillum celere]SFC31711.1 thiamine biosynthesis lipoprotein [Marinospirillum celere]